MILTERGMSNDEIKAEYTSSLADLTFNSKPLINMLTILAEENQDNAPAVVAAIEEHLAKVQTDVKLPILYLVDCIAKNIGGTYTTLFSHNIVKTFCSVFKVVDEKTRAEMFKLRQTWNDIFPQTKLYAIDVQIKMLDPAWPVTAQPTSNSIHLNPKFLKNSNQDANVTEAALATDPETCIMQQQLLQKQKELLELQRKKVELELLQTQVKLQNQLKGNAKVVANSLQARPQNILLKPEVANQLMPRTKMKSGLAPRIPASGNIPKIAPVNSALVAASSRPTRDPRLLRQQTETSINSSSSVSLGSKTAILDSNNKIVTNSKSVRDSRSEPRLVNNKDTVIPSQKSGAPKPKAFQKSRMSTKSHQRLKSSSDNNLATDSKSFSSKSASSSASSSTINLLDSPTKSSSKSPTKSPSSRHKKHEKKSFKEMSSSKRERDSGGSGKSHKNDSSSPPTAFKGVKGSKNRNYMRRNRSPNYSPEHGQDVDLRMPPEKQARLQDDDKLKATTSQAGMDVDLRQLPAVVGKKRPSTETMEQPPKKSKSEMIDVLFGHEDTDLRTVLPTPAQPERPPTPPPPIISSIDKEKDSPSKKASNLDAIRAKLANATGRDRIMAQSFRKKRVQEDEDLRIPPPSPRSANDSLKKIIISSDDEQCIKTGKMTKEQEKQLMNKIIAQIEHQKLKEAQQKDKEESLENLQPVSDEELDFQDETFGDKDDRVNFPKYSRDLRDSRRGGSYWRGGKRRPWENPHVPSHPHQRPSLRPWHHPMNAWRPIGPNFANNNNNNNSARHQVNDYDNGSQDDGRKSPEVPNDLVVDSVNQDDIKTINIDGVPRDIRYYDETAIIFMNWDDPREISFQSGSRRVMFDDKDVYILSFNENYKDISIQGVPHRVRLGAPSREIFIDCKPYECYFGGPGITIDLNGQMTVVKLDGPPPQVKIGTDKRTDLVAGKVNLIIDAKILVPVFLDAKLQKFVIDGETHTLKFVDALKTVLINDVPFKVEFGGLPKPITVHDKKHFIRFSVLPRGVKPGFVRIKDMEGVQVADEDSQEAPPVALDINEPALPVFAGQKRKVDDEQDRNSNSPHFFQNFMQQNNLDVLSSVMTSSLAAAASTGGYQVENLQQPPEIHSNQAQESAAIVKPAPTLPASLNINELFQKLVATGIVATKEPIDNNTNNAKPIKKNTLENLRPITFAKPETLKIRQNLLYEALYSGMQCSSCGMRFPPEQSIHYSQHLDWHFRQNRKGKKNIRVAASRRWYYSLSDWKNYEEIEDLEEREKNYFDQQQSQAENQGDENEEEIEIPSVPADPDVQDAHCEVCQDRFDHFFNEDKEEWHLKNAIRVEDKTYHPVCYEDYQNSLLESANESREEDSSQEDNAKTETQSQNIPGLEIILDDDDDEADEVVIEESDDSKTPEDIKDDGEDDKQDDDDDDDDDDVIIHEVIPEQIEVDEDREYIDPDPAPPVECPVKVEHVDDGFMDVEEGLITIKNGGEIKIKSEPVDPDEIPVVDAADEPVPFVETTQPGFISSIDGNTEPLTSVPATTAPIGGKIKINISKPLPVITHKEPKEVICDSAPILEPMIDPSQPLPPGEEPVQLNLKPALQGVELKKLPPVRKGSELTGMCSIM